MVLRYSLSGYSWITPGFRYFSRNEAKDIVIQYADFVYVDSKRLHENTRETRVATLYAGELSTKSTIKLYRNYLGDMANVGD